MEDKDLQNVNEIDMEIDESLLDDDDSFGSAPIKISKPNTFDGEEIESDFDDRPLKSVTGIKINLSDDDSNNIHPSMLDDVPVLQSETIKCNSEQDIRNAANDMNTPFGIMNNANTYSAFGDADYLECNIGEDDDVLEAKPKRKILMDDDFEEPELVNEDIINENKPAKVSQGKVEDDYWERIAKRHKASNVKGAHNLHAHYGGDPKLAMDMFNHDAKPQGKIPTITDGQPATTIATDASYTADISSGEMSGGEGMACGESVKKDNNRQLFENLLIITGFDLQPLEKGFLLKDKCNMIDDVQCNDEKDCINQLRPYIDDTFIVPLQFQTGEQFKEPNEWVDWYTPEMEKKYPKCKSDIDYCKMILKYLN